MRILIDQAVYDQRNLGNVALLQAAIDRLSVLWPNARIEVLTEAPHLLRVFCPTAYPISVYPRGDLSTRENLLDSLYRHMPDPLLMTLFALREELKQVRQRPHTDPQVVGEISTPPASDEVPAAATDGAISLPSAAGAISDDESQAMNDADLVVATGGGYMVDSDSRAAFQVLARLERAIELKKPTVMVGQGMAIQQPELYRRAKEVLPRVDLIFVRESRIAPPLLSSLGVPMERVVMTGDDAVELAYAARRPDLGTGIGVNLRLAQYTAVGREAIQMVQPVLSQAAGRHHAQLLPIPISQSAYEADAKYIRELIGAWHRRLPRLPRFHTPDEMIRQTTRCRLVVTGAFHPAVFALAQGIPVVGLAKSNEYVDKFLGLREQFGPGCQVVSLNDPGFQDKITEAIEAAWGSAEQVKPGLLRAAERQIEIAHTAHQRIRNLIN
jgi:polysaccharide pyruvyl transferase WcaK-like protein